ncbi:MAG: Flp family type IVb pilin [Solirubrobacterales bacterium]
MRKHVTFVARLLRDESASTLIEYSLIATLISLTVIALSPIGQQLQSLTMRIAGEIAPP